MPTNPAKAAKVDAVLSRTKKASLDDLLVKEVQTVLKSPPNLTLLTVLRSFLKYGADVNAQMGAALCHAVAAANMPISDLLLGERPNPASLASALPCAIHIADPMDRLTFAQKLLEAGAPSTEANRALVYVVNSLAHDLPLIRTLASKAESRDGEALLSAVKQERPEIVELLLRSSNAYTAEALNPAFLEATNFKDKQKRLPTCKLLLEAGADGSVVSDGLLAAAAEGDLELGGVLVGHGASVEHKEGQAIVEACRSGAAQVLQMLLASGVEVKKTTLARGFQAATEVGDLKKRADVFRLLLEKGVNDDVINAQLVSSARFGDDGTPLVRLLLEFGADVNYNSGEAVWTAARSTFMNSLKLMLGVAEVEGRQHKPSKATLVKVLKASWRLSRAPRFQVIDWLFQAGLQVSEEVHVALNKAVKDDPDLDLVNLLLSHGASPLTNGCQTLIDATQNLLVDVVAILLEGEIAQTDLSWVFRQSYTPATAETWLSVQGFEIAQKLIEKGAKGEGLSSALGTSIDALDSGKDVLARRFVDLLLQSEVDVNAHDGVAVQKAAQRGDPSLIQKVLSRKPNSTAVSMAFPYIFDLNVSENEILHLISLFSEYHDGEERLDAMFTHPESEPVVFRALSQFPRSASVLEALLDAGYYQDQRTTARVMLDIEDEQVSLLFWALLQPQKKISDNVIGLLIARGAKINFETRISKMTPLMLAVKDRRRDIIKTLILEGAEVDVTDATGNTPLTMATQIGGDLGKSIMSNILAADPAKNDGSLHNAARELNLDALKVLFEYGHELDFPSPLHNGRSALGELCLNAATSEELTAAREKKMEKTIAYIIGEGTDLSIQCEGKSVLLLALESRDPVTTTRALLKVGMWKYINKSFNYYNDSKYTYSPTQYASRLLPESDAQDQLLALLRANRAIDVYYANDGPQPEDAVNIPAELLRGELERKARLERIVTESEDHARKLAMKQETATIHNQIFLNRAELEDARARRKRDEELEGMRQKSTVKDELFAVELRRRKADREAGLEHEQALTEAGLTRARLVAEAELEFEGRKQASLLEWEQNIGSERVDNAKALSTIRVSEREYMDRFDAANDARLVKRITEQKRLVDSQDRLASRVAGGGINGRRQIGFISGELD
jgi:ankyrin repeat protein